MNPFDDPPQPAHELSQLQSYAESPQALPRLSIVHLMMWMATTAVAFAPLSWWNPAAFQGSATRASAATFSLTVSGLAAGTYLFVIAATLYWRSKGYSARFEPGHWFAIRGAASWAQGLLIYALMFSSGSPGNSAFRYLPLIQLVFGSMFFALFAWLAIRAPEPPRWRWTYATFAIVPVFGAIAGMALMLVSSGPSPLPQMAAQVGAYLVQALVLLAALRGDFLHRTPRHWTHWLAMAVYVAALAANILIYAAYLAFPQLLRAG